MKTDLLNRRLRFAPPNAIVHRLVLTEADYLLFEAIDRHGPLPSNYLYEFTKQVRKDRTHLQNRLTEFYNGDTWGPFLTRPPQQFAAFEARYQHLVYDLAPRARRALADRERALLPRPEAKCTGPFLHQLMQACVGASFELCAPAKGLRYISSKEILSHPGCGEAKDAANPMAIRLPGIGDQSLIPDDLFGLEYPGRGFRFFAVEIDRNTESIERKATGYNTWGKKVAAYSELLQSRFYREWWGIPNLSVLTVTTNGTHARNILDYIGRQGTRFADRFAFHVEAGFGANWRVPKTALTCVLDLPWFTTTGLKDIGKQ
jgi:hypothetical protein